MQSHLGFEREADGLPFTPWLTLMIKIVLRLANTKPGRVIITFPPLPASLANWVSAHTFLINSICIVNYDLPQWGKETLLQDETPMNPMGLITSGWVGLSAVFLSYPAEMMSSPTTTTPPV